MIQANELRIGSAVIYKWFDKRSTNGKQRTIIHREIVKILAVDSVNKRVLLKTNQTRRNHTWINIGSISSIVITEELLLKCGFDRTTYITKGIEIEITYYKLKNIVIYLLHDFFEIEIITPDGQFNLYKSFEKHLHQLQNLFFALTGQELEVEVRFWFEEF